jgi:hypothetical protein
MKMEHLQKVEEKRQNENNPQVGHHYHGPRVIRGGSTVNDSNTPKSLRGGGGKSTVTDTVPEDDTSFTKQASTVTSGLISRLLGAK